MHALSVPLFYHTSVIKERGIFVPKKKTPKIRAAVLYARYSSHAQKDASIEQQVEQCLKYAAEKKISDIDTYADRAVSGRSDRRAEFQRMMKDAEKHKFACVIAWKSNRMGRNMLQAMTNEAKLHELGIHVRYTEEEFDDSAAGRFALRSMMNVNQFYSENMAEDVRRGMMDKMHRTARLQMDICHSDTSGIKI